MLAPEKSDVWDSGKVQDSHPFNVSFAGRPLKSGERCFWTVKVWDRAGRDSAWSKPALFEMGLLSPADWVGRWINDGKSNPTHDADFYKDDPAPLFRKRFEVSKPVKTARLYIAGLGYYEAHLNGSRVGDHVLDPGWTKFGTRVYYSVYDVGKQLQPGANCLGVTLGNGWYNPLPMKLFGAFNLRQHLDVGRPRFIAQLKVEFEDGTSETIASDRNWKVGESEILFNNVYLGERVDARKESVGWSSPAFDDRTWKAPRFAEEPIGDLEAQPQPPIKVTGHLKAVKVWETGPGVFVYDFGREFAGWANLRLVADAGTRVVMRYGELLYPDGRLNPMTSVAGQIKGDITTPAGLKESVGGPGAPPIAWQTDTYVARGGGEESYTPRFTFHGFRYMEVAGLAKPLPLEAVTGLTLSASVEDAGAFSCSNPMFNDIQTMCRRTFLSNLFSVQSDCPHRERLGYGGDMVGTSEAFLMNFDMSGFYAKTVQDFADAARPDGMLTDTAPFIGIQYCGVGWALAHPLLTHQLGSYYGNRRLVAEQYETAKRWLDLVAEKYESGIVTDGLSDHESLEPTPPQVLVTPLYSQAAHLLASMAQELGRHSDEVQFLDLAEKIRAAYVKTYLDPHSGKIGTGTQASQSFALYSHLVPPEDREKALAALVSDIRAVHAGHLTTGLMGTKFMLDVLSRSGHAEDAYAIVDQRDFPGWGWMLRNGATTLWEHWALDDNTFSHCHPMFGSVSQWFFNWLGGIQPADGSVGFDKIVIRPQFVKELTWVKSSHRCLYGEIESNWTRSGSTVQLEVEIPFGSSAQIYLPVASASSLKELGSLGQNSKRRLTFQRQGSSNVISVGSGRYRFSYTE
jgi:alpha-L-rhamnosidase